MLVGEPGQLALGFAQVVADLADERAERDGGRGGGDRACGIGDGQAALDQPVERPGDRLDRLTGRRRQVGGRRAGARDELAVDDLLGGAEAQDGQHVGLPEREQQATTSGWEKGGPGTAGVLRGDVPGPPVGAATAGRTRG